MKKSILLIILVAAFFITACGSSRSETELLDYYVEAYSKGDYEAFKKAFPQTLIENMTKEAIDSGIENIKKEYGDDYTIKYVYKGKKKLDFEEYKDDYEMIKNYYGVEMSDCYSLDVVFTYSGSKSTKDEIYDLKYCKFDGEWYLTI